MESGEVHATGPRGRSAHALGGQPIGEVRFQREPGWFDRSPVRDGHPDVEKFLSNLRPRLALRVVPAEADPDRSLPVTVFALSDITFTESARGGYFRVH